MSILFPLAKYCNTFLKTRLINNCKRVCSCSKPFFYRENTMDYKVNAIGSNNKPQLEMKHKQPKEQKLKEGAEKKMSFEQYLQKEMRK